MKTTKQISLLSILTLAMLVGGCGGAGQTTASLEIVNGFLVSANGYDGGLVIYGKSDDGKSFSIPVTNSTSAKVELPNGNWTFRAVGWGGDNSDLTMKFSNTPFCGSATASLNGEDVSLSLGLAAAKCDSDEFASAVYRDAGNFRELFDLATFKSFMVTSTPTDTPAAKTIQGSDSISSIMAGMPDDMESPVQSIRIFALSKDVNSSEYTKSSLQSNCMATVQKGVANKNGVYGGRPFLFPTKGTPFGVELYYQNNCTDTVTLYQFPQGFEGPANGDHLLQVDISGKNRLVLSATETRKGYSSMYAHMPMVKCFNGTVGHCLTSPLSPPHFVLRKSITERVFIKGRTTCGTPVFTGSPPISLGVGGCTVTSDGLEVVIDTSGASNTVVYTLAIPGMTYNIGILDNLASDREKFSAYEDMIKGMGPSNYDTYPKSFLSHGGYYDNNDDQIAYGRLGKVREHLSPAGAMSLFGIVDPTQTFQDNCLAVSGTKEITLKDDDGSSETMRVVVSSGSGIPTDTWTCNTGDPNASTCVINYDKKIQVFNLNVSSSVPQMTMAIDCHSLVGKFESDEIDLEDGNTRKYRNQQILSWNSNPDASLMYQRYEYLERDQEWEYLSGAWSLKGEQRAIGRVFKTSPNTIQTNVYSFNTYKDGSSWRQQLDARHLHVVPGAAVTCLKNVSQAEPSAATDTHLLTAGGAVASIRTTQAMYAGFAPSQLNHTNTFAVAAVTAATTTCSSANSLQALPPANNNDLINKALPATVNSLADGFLDAEFGTFLNL